MLSKSITGKGKSEETFHELKNVKKVEHPQSRNLNKSYCTYLQPLGEVKSIDPPMAAEKTT